MFRLISIPLVSLWLQLCNSPFLPLEMFPKDNPDHKVAGYIETITCPQAVIRFLLHDVLEAFDWSLEFLLFSSSLYGHPRPDRVQGIGDDSGHRGNKRTDIRTDSQVKTPFERVVRHIGFNAVVDRLEGVTLCRNLFQYTESTSLRLTGICHNLHTSEL